MALLNDLFRRAADASRPDPAAVDRVYLRIARSVRGDRDAAKLLRGVGAPDPDVVDRLRDRLLVPRRSHVRVRALLAAAAVILATLAWRLTPSRPGDDALTLELDAEDVRTLEATEDVALRYTGHGQARGSRQAPRIAWEQGRIELEVTPGQGIALVVATPEAEVAVVGTVFDVDRDALGTTVHVSRGEVEVRCVEGPTHRLVVGDSVNCPPVDAAGLLGRARTLRARGAPLDDVLSTLDHALVAPGDLPLRGEVLATRTRVLLEAGRTADAVATARRYLDEGHAPRRDELRALVEAYATAKPEVSP